MSKSEFVVMVACAISAGCSGGTGDSAVFHSAATPKGADAGSGQGAGDFSGGDPLSDGGSPAACNPLATAPGLSVGAAYQSSYSVHHLDGVPGLPPQKFGGMTLKNGDPSTLLIGCYAKYDSVGTLYSIGLARSCGHITGFVGTAVQSATAPNVDATLEYAPNGVLLFTGYPQNTLGEIAPGGTTPARTLDLTAAGISASVGTATFVPKGFGGEGTLKLVSADTGKYYDASLILDASGLYDVGNVAQKLVIPGGPEGLSYVPRGSPNFAKDSVIVSEWSSNVVVTYEIDASGDPILSTRTPFLDGIAGPEGAFFDSETGDFIFSTWSENDDSNELYVVQGFAPSAR